mmetsp:Transcript_21689/g.47131  ORF Transcript_21689/g.47131 Transcript_21689/m.47131 type:complete len:207 (+) Transcript_21689:590-1210(+)
MILPGRLRLSGRLVPVTMTMLVVSNEEGRMIMQIDSIIKSNNKNKRSLPTFDQSHPLIIAIPHHPCPPSFDRVSPPITFHPMTVMMVAIVSRLRITVCPVKVRVLLLVVYIAIISMVMMITATTAAKANRQLQSINSNPNTHAHPRNSKPSPNSPKSGFNERPKSCNCPTKSLGWKKQGRIPPATAARNTATTTTTTPRIRRTRAS